MSKSIVIVAALAATLGGAIWYKESTEQPLSQRVRPTPSVVVAAVESGPVRLQVEALGTVRANESVVLSAKVTESVQKVHFSDGQSVQQDELLVTLQDAEQQAKLQAAQANLTEQEREYQRIEGLVKTKTVASSELDKLRTSIDIAKAQLAQQQAELDARYVRAPFAGVLGFRQISQGALVTPGTAITTLDDLSVVKLDFTVPERFLSELSIGKTVEGKAAAFPSEIFKGEVVSVDSRVDPQTRAIVVRAKVANDDLKLRPGMLMTLNLIAEERNGLLVPEAAVVPRQQSQFLFVVNSEGKVEQRKVTIGLRSRGEAEILSGVDNGEQVIIRGLQKVRPGQTVETRTEERFTHLEAS